jgi:hypothetical protein
MPAVNHGYDVGIARAKAVASVLFERSEMENGGDVADT